MLPRTAARRLRPRAPPARRWITPAPRPGDGPLMTRRADRALPDVARTGFRSLPLFLGGMALAAAAVFNYQKASSPVVAAALYALRTSPRARTLLGDDIGFRHAMPWVRGSVDQLHGRVDVRFGVRGDRGAATMRFAAARRGGGLETAEWSLTMDADGARVDLLEDAGWDPFRGLLGDDVGPARHDEGLHATRGFRQQGALNK